MNSYAVLTAIGADRPGLVEEVSRFILEHGGNIEDSRMVNLRGEFAMMLLVSAPQDAQRTMQSAAPQLIQKSGLHIEIRRSAPVAPSPRPALPYRLKASALDQAGLVHRVAHLLRSLQVNIETMQSDLAAAPVTGAPVFEMEMVLSVPGELPLSQLRQKLGALCDELNIDWQLAAL